MTAFQAVLFDLGDTLVDLGEGRGDYEAHVRVRAGRVYDALTAAGVALEELGPVFSDPVLLPQLAGEEGHGMSSACCPTVPPFSRSEDLWPGIKSPIS